MRKTISKMNILIVALGLLMPAVLVAQKEEKVKETKEKKEVRQIIVTSKGDKDEKVVIEIKSVDALNDVHLAQTLTYLKLGNYKLGLLINFNVALLKQGIKRVANGI